MFYVWSYRWSYFVDVTVDTFVTYHRYVLPRILILYWQSVCIVSVILIIFGIVRVTIATLKWLLELPGGGWTPQLSVQPLDNYLMTTLRIAFNPTNCVMGITDVLLCIFTPVFLFVSKLGFVRILEALRGNLAMFTRLVIIAPPKVNWFGWNLKHSGYIVGSWPWQILGAIRAVATVWQAGKILLVLSRKYRTISPIYRRQHFMNFEHSNVDRWRGETFGIEFWQFLT